MTVLFSDLEGRLHMLDYDKKFLIKSWDNLTFDGRRFAALRRSGKAICGWALTGLRSTGRRRTIFGPGKVLVFGEVIDKDGTPYSRRYPRRAQEVCRQTSQERLHAERGQRD